MKRIWFIVVILFVCGSIAASWQKVETMYTTIIFEEVDQEAAFQLATFADEVLLELAQFLDHLPAHRVPVILAGRTAWANGMYAPIPSSITLYLASDEDHFLGSKTPSWLKSVYTHELTHYLHLTKAEGLAKLLRFLGPAVTSIPTPFMPGWWVEGITTYVESTFGEGGRGNSLTFGLLTQKPIDEGEMWSLSQGAYGGAFFPSSRIYATGYLVIEYLVRNYGVSAFNEINKTFAAFPFAGMNWIFKKVIGITAKELYTKAVKEREEHSAPPLGSEFYALASGSAFLPTQTEVGLLGLTASPRGGSRLVDYESEKIITTLPLSKNSALSLGNRSALYSSLWVDSASSAGLPLAPEGYSELTILDLFSGQRRQLTKKQRLLHPRISSDGTFAVASELIGSYYDLVAVDLNDGSTNLLLHEEGASFLDSALNKDGSLIATIKIKEGNSSLLLIDDEGVHELIGPTADELTHPRFLDDGSLLFSAELATTFGAYHLDLNNRVITELFTDANGIFGLDVINDGYIYETAAATGRAVRSLSLGEASVKEGVFAPARIESTPNKASEFVTEKFYDTLRFNLALPYPFKVGNQWRPGLLLHFSSLLRKHTLTAQVGVELDHYYPYLDVTYQYQAGRVIIQSNVAAEEATQSFQAMIQITLASMSRPKSLMDITFQGGADIIHHGNDRIIGNVIGSIGSVIQSRTHRASDFFGPSFAALSVKEQLQFQNEATISIGSFSLQGQSRLFSSSVMVHGSVNYFQSNHALSDTFFSIYGFPQIHPMGVDTKLHLGATLRIPLALLDQPFLYGGFTGLGLEVGAQTALYPLTAGTFTWERVVGFQAKLSAEYTLGAGADLTLYAALNILTNGWWSYSIGIEGLSLF